MSKLFNELVQQTIDKPVETRWHRIDEVTTYFGTAEANTPEDARGWSIKKIVDNPDGGTCFANGDSNDDKIWTLYDQYSYAL